MHALSRREREREREITRCGGREREREAVVEWNRDSLSIKVGETRILRWEFDTRSGTQCPPIACEILSHFLFFSFSKSSVLLLLVLVLSKNSSIRRKLFIVESKSIGKDSSRDLINFLKSK